MKKLIIDYLTRYGCECKIDPNGKYIIVRRSTSDGNYYHLFAVPRSISEVCCLTSRCFPEYLGLRPRCFSDVGALSAFLSTA